jgi:UDP-glucose 4-epimerase
MKTILVTGGSGFLGKHLITRLLSDDWSVVSVDRRPVLDGENPKVKYILGDLRDEQVRAECFREPLAAVVHLAASTSVVKSEENPEDYFTNNVEVTQKLLELCRVTNVPRFVFASSTATTGEVGAAPISPDFPLRPKSPYGASKAAGEMLVTAYGNCYALRTVNVRFTNIYGPGLAQKDSLISRLMKGALEGRGIEIHGDGSTSRDYLYVEDAVDALIFALGVDTPTTVIAGSGHSSTILETIAAVSEFTGVTPELKFGEKNRLQMSHVLVDTAIGESLGYRAKWSFRDGLRETWKSFLH